MRHKQPVKWTREAAGSSLCREMRAQKGGGCRADGQTGELVCRQTEAAGRGRPWFTRIPCTRPASKEDPQPDQGGKPFSEGLGPCGRTRSLADGSVSSARGAACIPSPPSKQTWSCKGHPPPCRTVTCRQRPHSSHCVRQADTPNPAVRLLNAVWGLNDSETGCAETKMQSRTCAFSNQVMERWRNGERGWDPHTPTPDSSTDSRSGATQSPRI